MRRLTSLVLILTLRVVAQQADFDELLKQAVREQQSGDYASAIRDYRRILRIRPHMFEAQVNLGAALSDTGHYDEAIATLRQALGSAGDRKPVLMNLALAYFRKGEYENAREPLLQVHQLTPEDQQVTRRLADVDLRSGHAQQAVALLEPWDAQETEDLEFQYLYGRALIGAGRAKDGVLRVQRVAETANRADAYMVAGSTLLTLNEFKVAREDLERALRLDPTLPGIYALVGVAQDQTGDPDAAEPNLRAGLRANPDDFEANLTLGAILAKRRNLVEAEPYLEHALKLRPKDRIARYQWGVWKVAMGEYATAAEVLAELSKEYPDWIDPHIELSTLYYKLHRPEDGKKERQVVERLQEQSAAKPPKQ